MKVMRVCMSVYGYGLVAALETGGGDVGEGIRCSLGVLFRRASMLKVKGKGNEF